MRLDRNERMKESEMKREVTTKPLISSGSISKKKGVIGSDGKLVWVEDDSPKANDDFDPDPGYMNLRKLQKNSKQQKNNNNFNNNNNDNDSSDDEEQINAIKPTPDMPNNIIISLVMRKLKKSGFPATLDWLVTENNFPPKESAAYISIAAHILNSREMQESEGKEMNMKEMNMRESGSFKKMESSGFRLGSSSDSTINIKLSDLPPLIDDFQKIEISEVDNKIQNKSITVNPDKPQTRIRVKLIDGSSETIKLNTNHTVSDLKYHIESLSKTHISKFNIATNRPRKIYSNNEQTIEEAELVNSSIIQEKI